MRTRTTVGAIGAGLTVACLAVSGVGGAARAAVGPAVTTPSTVTKLAGSLAPFVSDTPVAGIVPAAERLTIQVWLRPQSAAADRFAQAVSSPGSSQFHQYLSPDAYADRFAATPADASAVRAWLRAKGFTAVSIDPERAYVRATASAATINQAFDVRLTLYKAFATVNAGGDALRSNDRPVSLPATLSRLVLGVTGLDNAAPTDSASGLGTTPKTDGTDGADASATSAPCSVYFGQHLRGGLPKYLGRTSFPTTICGYSARQLRAVYGANTTNTGTGQTIALVELAPPDPDDLVTLQDYAKVTGLPAPSPKRFAERTAGKGCSETSAGQERRGDGPAIDYEEQMDVEAAYLMAPGANEIVVAGGACGGSDPETQALLNAVQGVLDGSGHHPLASIASNSWESGPEGQPASETKIEHAELVQAATEGVGMYLASGDSSGVSAPADDPYAIAVGGTTLGIGRTRSRVFETGWSTGFLQLREGKWIDLGSGDDAAGGGPSTQWKQPAYQRGVVPAALSRVPGRSAPYRSVPDISADADPNTAMAVGVLSETPGKKPTFVLTPGGGTSLATPLVAGMVAAAQQGSKTPFGFLDPVLYKLAGTSALYDDLPFTPATPAVLRAEWCSPADCGLAGLNVFEVQSTDQAKGYSGQVTRKGYDNMTGVGTPNGQAFIKALRALEK